MTNKYFPEEEITKDDLFFICYMIERVARKLKQKNAYIVESIGSEELNHLISVANVLHAENPLAVEEEWIEAYGMQPGEDYVQGICRVYSNSICDVIDNYNCSAYYEPSYVLARAYQDGGF